MATHSEFGPSTDATAVAKAFPEAIKNKVILITGANALGIGGSTATALATQGPKLLILSGRSKSKVQEVIAAVNKINPNVPTRFVELDLSSLASVRKAAAEVNSYEESIDILINNAGVMAIPERQLSPDGIEMQLATNHIGHFLFTALIGGKIIDAAKKSSAGATRIINVSSFGHMFSPVRFSDLSFEKVSSQLPEAERPNMDLINRFGLSSVSDGHDHKAPGYSGFVAYGQSKTANVLFSLSLSQKLAAHGIKSFGLHPGSIGTELGRNMNSEMQVAALEARKASTYTRKSLEQGSSTTLVAALDPSLKADGKNVYLNDCQLAEAAPWAVDSEAAEKLWKLSEKLVGETFNFA